MMFSGGEVLIISPVTLLQIHCGHSELRVSKYLTYGAFQLFTPCNWTAAVHVLPTQLTESQTDSFSPKTSQQTQCGCSVSHPLLAFLSCLALSVYQNTLHSPVSAPPQPACVGSPESDAVCCGALTLGIMQTGHSACMNVCVCLLRVGLSLFRLSGWLSDGRNQQTSRAVDMTPRTHSILLD